MGAERNTGVKAPQGVVGFARGWRPDQVMTCQDQAAGQHAGMLVLAQGCLKARDLRSHVQPAAFKEKQLHRRRSRTALRCRGCVNQPASSMPVAFHCRTSTAPGASEPFTDLNSVLGIKARCAPPTGPFFKCCIPTCNPICVDHDAYQIVVTHSHDAA